MKSGINHYRKIGNLILRKYIQLFISRQLEMKVVGKILYDRCLLIILFVIYRARHRMCSIYNIRS